MANFRLTGSYSRFFTVLGIVCFDDILSEPATLDLFSLEK